MSKEYKDGDLRVWWIPNVPGKPHTVDVKDIDQAKFVLNALADYDLFLLANDLRDDYSNAGGLWMYEDGVWEEWEDGMGGTIEDLMFEDSEIEEQARRAGDIT